MPTTLPVPSSPLIIRQTQIQKQDFKARFSFEGMRSPSTRSLHWPITPRPTSVSDGKIQRRRAQAQVEYRSKHQHQNLCQTPGMSPFLCSMINITRMTQINKAGWIILCKTGRDGRTMRYVGVNKYVYKGLVGRREGNNKEWMRG